jgi:hypothetical protein
LLSNFALGPKGFPPIRFELCDTTRASQAYDVYKAKKDLGLFKEGVFVPPAPPAVLGLLDKK